MHLFKRDALVKPSMLTFSSSGGGCYVCQNYVFYIFDKVMSCIIPVFFSFKINLVSSAILEVLL